MQIAVLSDVHGYSLALDRVLDDIAGRQIDQLVIAGDLCEGGPDPAGAIAAVQAASARCVYGNTDEDVMAASAESDSITRWTRDQVGQDGVAYLQSLPFSIRIQHPRGDGDPATDLLVVHANPTNVYRHLSPNASDRELREIIGDEPAGTIAFGHLHVAYTRTVDDTTLVDVSAVGNPRDGDLRPRYVVFDGSGDGWTFTYHYVDYPLDATREQMESAGMPNWKKAYDRLVAATYNRSI
jgi:predicted phosphodiesterase